MSTNLLHKLLDVFYVTRVFDLSHWSYLAGRGTGLATIMVINYQEDAVEKQKTSKELF